MKVNEAQRRSHLREQALHQLCHATAALTEPGVDALAAAILHIARALMHLVDADPECAARDRAFGIVRELRASR